MEEIETNEDIDVYKSNLKKEYKLFYSLIAYYLISYIENVSEKSQSENIISIINIFITQFIPSIIGGISVLILFGFLWFGLSTKIIKGKLSIKETIIEVGNAFFIPALSSLICIPIIALYIMLEKNYILFIVLTIIQLIIGIWALIRSFKITKKLNEFDTKKMVFIGVWPIFIFIIFIFIYTIFSLI